MANLLGKADQTLVKGAYSVAKANLPGDMSGVYNQRAKNMEGLMAGISAVWEELNSEWNDRQNALSTKGDAVYENVLTGKYNDQMVEATDAAVLDIKSRLKGQKADKKGVGARKIEAEMNSFAKNTQQNALDFEELADLSKNNELIIKGSGSEAKLLEAVFDDFNNNTNNTQVTYKDGDFTYTLDGVSMTMGDIKKAMIKKDNTKPSAVQGIFNEVVTKAGSEKRESSDVYKNDIKNRIKSSMTNKSDKTNIMHSHFEGLQYTFYEALTGKDQGLQDQIFDTLMAIGTDIDKDGVADTKDTYLNTENAVALQREILNNDNSGDIIAGFLTDNLFQDAYDRGVKERKVIKTGGKEGDNKEKSNPYGIPSKGLRLGIPMPNGYRLKVRKDVVEGYINDIKSGTKFEFKNNKYTYVDGGWIENEGGMFRPGEPAPERKIGDTQTLTDQVFENGGKYFDGLITEMAVDPTTGKTIGQDNIETPSGVQSSFSSSINMDFMDKDDNDIATSLQNMMPSAFSGKNPNGYQFKNLRSLLMDDFTAEAVGLYDDDENIIRYPEGHPKEGDKVIIYTGGNKERRMKAISTLDDILNTKQFKIKGFGGESAGNDEYYNLITN